MRIFRLVLSGATAAAVALACMAAAPAVGVAGARPSCRRLVVLYNSNPKRSIAMHTCDRVRVELAYGPDGVPPSFWNVSRRPSKKVVKLIAAGGQDTQTDSPKQFWTYRAVAPGRTYVKFALTTPSYPGAWLGSFRLSITVSPRG